VTRFRRTARLRVTAAAPMRFWRRMSLRARLALAATIAVAAGVIGAAGFAYLAVRHQLVQQADEGLTKQAGRVKDRLDAIAFYPGWRKGIQVDHPPQFGETQGRIQIVLPDGTALTEHGGMFGSAPNQPPVLPITDSTKAIAAGAPGQIRSITFNGEHLRLLTEPVEGARALQLAVPLADIDQQLSTLGWELFAAGGAGILLAALGGWLVTRTALRPVSDLTDAAERIATTHDLAHRIEDTRHGGRDELGRLAASFNSMLDAVQEATDRQRQLVADASHELRTPLTSLRTNVEVLARADRLDQDDRDALVAGIMSGIDDLTALVSDTVELARGEEQAGQFEELRLDRLVRRCVDRATAHWPNVRFEATLPECVVVGVSDRLAKAVRNLLDNAAKFSPPGGVIEVETAVVGADAVLTVRDHGPGVAPADLPHVFDRFYRAANARDLQGSGLGLAIVAQVAAGHRGTVTAAAAEGGGALFRLTVPVAGPGPS
jgi:two-component system sensor histidine kinase MprB